jgi:hypothetical protein
VHACEFGSFLASNVEDGLHTVLYKLCCFSQESRHPKSEADCYLLTHSKTFRAHTYWFVTPGARVLPDHGSLGWYGERTHLVVQGCRSDPILRCTQLNPSLPSIGWHEGPDRIANCNCVCFQGTLFLLQLQSFPVATTFIFFSENDKRIYLLVHHSPRVLEHLRKHGIITLGYTRYCWTRACNSDALTNTDSGYQKTSHSFN